MSLPPTPIPDPESLIQPAPLLAEAVPASALETIVLPPAEPRFPAWSGWDVLAVLVFTAVSIFVFSVAALLIAWRLPGYRGLSIPDLTAKLATNATLIVGAQAAAYVFVLLFVYMLVQTRSRARFATAIQWNWPGTSAPGFVVGGVILALVIDGLSRYLPIPKSLPMDNFFTDATSAYMMAIFGVTLAPLLEELFFRGLLYPLLRRAVGLIAAVVLTALAFAGIHGAQLGYAWAPILSIFVVGVVFTVVRERRNSVASSFLMHCGYNLTLFSMLWIASDHFRHLEKAAG
jgi:membrane protease YdiL (CAAX protease family)